MREVRGELAYRLFLDLVAHVALLFGEALATIGDAVGEGEHRAGAYVHHVFGRLAGHAHDDTRAKALWRELERHAVDVTAIPSIRSRLAGGWPLAAESRSSIADGSCAW